MDGRVVLDRGQRGVPGGGFGGSEGNGGVTMVPDPDGTSVAVGGEGWRRARRSSLSGARLVVPG